MGDLGFVAAQITLCGPGGCGKTRLAIESLRRLAAAHAFAEGVAWVDLSGLTDPALLVTFGGNERCPPFE